METWKRAGGREFHSREHGESPCAPNYPRIHSLLDYWSFVKYICRSLAPNIWHCSVICPQTFKPPIWPTGIGIAFSFIYPGSHAHLIQFNSRLWGEDNREREGGRERERVREREQKDATLVLPLTVFCDSICMFWKELFESGSPSAWSCFGNFRSRCPVSTCFLWRHTGRPLLEYSTTDVEHCAIPYSSAVHSKHWPRCDRVPPMRSSTVLEYIRAPYLANQACLYEDYFSCYPRTLLKP